MSWRRKKDLDFKHTCPVIDKGIQVVSSDVWEAIRGNLPGDVDDVDVEAVWDAVMKVVTDAFEDVRSTNMLMRAAADDQIDNLHNDLEKANDEVSRLENLVTDLEDKIERLEMEVA